MTAGEASIAEMRATQDATFDVVLSPVASAQRPALDAIRIVDSLFAIGRSEVPFADYPAERITRLSRRHARIFTEPESVFLFLFPFSWSRAISEFGCCILQGC